MKTIYEPKETKWDIVSLKTANVKFYSLIIILLFIGLSPVASQDLPNEMWHPGMIVLDSEDTLRGKIQYDFESNLLQYSQDKRIRTFTSQNVLYFSFHCQFFKRFRYVYSLPYQLKGRMNVPIFFEILAEGRITLMSREYVVTESNNRFGNPMYSSRAFSSREILTYDYYLLTENGDINRFSEKKKDLYPYFGRLEEKMKDYVKENRLHTDKQADLIKIIDHFNQISK
ncbi:MAG: hypothetical protein DSY77_09555 [Bacteroidetes bacterium]|nr:MAG: hypothetical protein DSY77_09555 [Bacteroidota bacterium]